MRIVLIFGMFAADLWTRIPLSMLQEGFDQQVDGTTYYIRIPTVSYLQGKSNLNTNSLVS